MSAVEWDKIFGEDHLSQGGYNQYDFLTRAPTIDACRINAAERENSPSVTKIGFSLGSAPIEMTAWFLSRPATQDLHPVRCETASRILIGTGGPPFERAPQRRRCFDGEANAPHA